MNRLVRILEDVNLFLNLNVSLTLLSYFIYNKITHTRVTHVAPVRHILAYVTLLACMCRLRAHQRGQSQSRSQSPRYPCPAERRTKSSFPVPLDKGNEGSGNEIGAELESWVRCMRSAGFRKKERPHGRKISSAALFLRLDLHKNVTFRKCFHSLLKITLPVFYKQKYLVKLGTTERHSRHL